MSRWPLVAIGEICIQDRQTLRSDDSMVDTLPFVGLEQVSGDSGEILLGVGSRTGDGKSSTFLFDERHVLYGKLRPYLNKVAVPNFRGRCSTELIPLLPNRRVDRAFLFHVLRRKETVDAVMAANTGSRMPRADMNVLLSLRIPIPPFSEQRRIVDILSRATGIRRLRHEAHEKAKLLILALFAKLFNDVSGKVDTANMGDVVTEFRYGTSTKSGPTGNPVLRIPNVIGGRVDLNDLKTVPLLDSEITRLQLADGDILFVRTNGNPDYVGRSAIFDSDLVEQSGLAANEFVFASYLIRARLDRSRANPIFLQAYLSTSTGRAALRERSRTSAGQYNINIEGLSSVPVLLPPLALQQAFADRVSDIQALITQQERAERAALALSGSLMTKLMAA